VRGKGVSKSGRFLILICVVVSIAIPAASPVEARSSFWISSRDENACIVSAVIQYDGRLEEEVRKENGIDNAVLQMDVHTREPQELCTMLMMNQNEHRWRPLLCVTKIRGNIYTGYLILPREFDLKAEIEISLGERTIRAKFLK